jgi:hypothetical protein
LWRIGATSLAKVGAEAAGAADWPLAATDTRIEDARTSDPARTPNARVIPAPWAKVDGCGIVPPTGAGGNRRRFKVERGYLPFLGTITCDSSLELSEDRHGHENLERAYES